ncbi:MAG: EAL domain-containing protein [Alphaproteobacteria bacterium]|nr:EAL domain-containing protein [Alphaproteobacteria bacterium]
MTDIHHGWKELAGKLPAPPLPFAASASAFLVRLQETIESCMEEHRSGCLLLISVDNLAMVLSAYGHDISETLMHTLVEQLAAQVLGPYDSIERLQRDQIGIVLNDSGAESSERTAARILNIVQNYGRDNFATATLHAIASIGAVHFPEETRDARDAMDKAYVALHCTQEGMYRPYPVSRAKADFSRQEMGLANYLHCAFQENRLRMAWQPVIATGTGQVAHYEGLLRLTNLKGQIVSAGPLIPVAEKMGLIDTIDQMVLERVAKELRLSPDVSLAFNVSNVTTVNPAWLERAHELIEETPDIAPRMSVEITETAVHRDLRRVAYFVASLQSLGCQVALDDFGSGYTSFRQLKALSVDMVKIDGVFVKDLATSADNRFFVKTLLDFIRGFGLKSVAEFVENGEIAKILMDMGVDYLQGYYFGKPDNHRRWLKNGEYDVD